ncbi:MAG TPA: DNA mismatch repair protein MutS [Bacteroidia bacterium]|nr:DNA mismatch repair protein MutS [Bacteroidia bacterium]
MSVHRSFIKSATSPTETPLMKQYNAIKGKYPDALLLFRVGDFYETFNEDAVKASKILGIVLTKRSNGAASHMDLAGFPYHALDTYLPKLVRAGQRVAICDQLEDPKTTKTIVKRGVTELVTPGVAFSEKILDHKSNNFLAIIHYDEKNIGIAFIDVSTGEFFVAQGNAEYIDKLLQNFNPSEVVFQKRKTKDFTNQYGSKFYTYHLDDWIFADDYARDTLLKHFEVSSLKGFGIEEMQQGIIAAGAALHYLQQMQQGDLKHISKVSRIEEERYVWLDKFTIRNLELISSPHEKAKTLIEVLDRTISPMGSRMLRRWLLLPLKEIEFVEERLDIVNHFVHHTDFTDKIRLHIKQIGDLERLISKVAIRKINPREVVQLKRALKAIDPIKEFCNASGNSNLKLLADQLNPCKSLLELIEKTMKEEPAVLITKGGVIADGVSADLDQLRQLAFSGKDYLLQIQKRESERTAISSLKVAFNNVFGYYIEVTNAHKNKVPSDWIRKQTLSNCERYITAELKEYEDKILGAEEKILALEEKLYNDLVSKLAEYIQPVQLNAAAIAKLDCLHSFAVVSNENNYVRPKLNDSMILDIKKGRHPVLEKQMILGEEYVANDVYLDNQAQQIIIITGPNMSGKSALLRQTALIVIMAQAGCFVPAQAADIGMIDKIFTRVGASDNISSGESTFMVEMNETASILNNISERSLVILDEIGRGTSTYDGISIAWAIAEFLHEHPSAKAKTLFATHYHELNEIAASYPRIKNFHVSVKELEKKVLFLRKLVPGGSEHSFGIHVAKMAGMPAKIIDRATKMLELLEKAHSSSELIKNTRQKGIKDSLQLSFFKLDDPVLEQIREEILKTDVNTLTPIEALMKLNEIKKLIGG